MKSEYWRYTPEMAPCALCGVQILSGREHPIEFCRRASAVQAPGPEWEPGTVKHLGNTEAPNQEADPSWVSWIEKAMDDT